LGKAIEFPEHIKMPKSLLLKPELSTMRECSWQKKEAMVMADAHNPDVESTPVLPYSPRQILK
jgi:glutamine synthetase